MNEQVALCEQRRYVVAASKKSHLVSHIHCIDQAVQMLCVGFPVRKGLTNNEILGLIHQVVGQATTA